MNNRQYYFTIIAIVLAFLTAFVALGQITVAEEVPQEQPEGSTSLETAAANCRYGATPLAGDQMTTVGELGAGWFLTFGVSGSVPVTGNNAQYVPVIRIREMKTNGQFNGIWYLNFDPAITGSAAETYVKSRVTALPSNMLWLIGNEIDRLTQDEIMPATYAEAYHQIYHWIKEVDPTAQVGISGLVQVTPLRLVYLDMIWDAYKQQFGTAIPVDVWNMHLYAIPEVTADGVTPGAAGVPVGVNLAQTTAVPKRASNGNAVECGNPDVYCYAEHDNMAVFAEQIIMMRQWMKNKGQQQKPLIISEFSILWHYLDTTGDGNPDFLRDEYGHMFTPQRIATFLQNTFNYLENTKDPNLGYALDDNRLVQQSMWFAVHTPWYDLNGDGVRDYWNWQAAPPGTASDLYRPINPPGNMTLQKTLAGQAFQDYVAATTPTYNLAIEYARATAHTTPLTLPTTITATLQVSFRNAGNTAVSTPYKVSFYDQNDALIGFVNVTDTIGGCGIYPQTVSVEWPIEVTNLSSTVLPFSVHVDADGVISETKETDNIAEGFVILNAKNTFLPVINR